MPTEIADPPENAPPFELIARGQGELLAQRMQARLAASPQDCGARYLLFAGLAACGRYDEARAALDQARLLHSLMELKRGGADLERLRRDADYAVNLAKGLYVAGHVALASVAYSAAIEAGCDDPESLVTYALSLQHQGRVEDAVGTFRAIGRQLPSAGATQFLLPALFAAEDGVTRHAAEARAWAARFAPMRPAPPFANSRSAGRPIRVGYFSPSFTQNQARQFIAPLFDHHDPEQVTVFAFASQVESANWASPVQMRTIGDLSDIAAADLIRSERIDVLIDCWGHNSGSRLPVFGLRPAPIMASWLNYQQTTGLSAMDYVIQVDIAQSDGVEALFTEGFWRTGDASAAFRPDPGPRASPAPCLAAGRVTFGAFINPAKLSDLTVELWSKILRPRPTSRLVLKYSYFVDPVLQMATQARFLAHGVNPAQIVFRGKTSGAAYHAEFAEIDLALDPTPCPGGTTTMEALSRGVPVLTLLGDTFYARLGASAVSPAGLPDLVAESPQAYVAKALELSADPAKLQAVRERVAPGFDAAPYRDEAGIARRLEGVYRGMFMRWCETAQAA